MALFKDAIKKVLHWEGGEVDHPNDPGGRTKFGISQRAFPHINMDLLTIIEAKEIYRQEYWERVNGDFIEKQAAAETLFDFAVNAGVSRAVRLAQGVSGAKVDGILGPNTLKCINNTDSFAEYFTLARIQYYTDLCQTKAKYRDFFFGWVRRSLSYLEV